MDSDICSRAAVVDLELPVVPANALRLKQANTLANRLREYLEIEKAHYVPMSRRSISTELKKLELFMAGREFSQRTVLDFCMWLKKNYTQSGYYLGVSVNRGFIRWLYRQRYITEPYHEMMPRVPAPPPKEIVLISEEQYQRFISVHRLKPLGWAMVLAYHTAFRLGDVCSLRWSEVDMKRQLITKIPSKTRRSGIKVEVPIISGSDLYEWLDIMSQDKDDPDIVCPELWRRYRHHCGLPHDFTLALRAVGINTTFHSLRKTFESRLANSGVNLAIAAKITGRTDPRSLMRYIKPDEQVVRQAVEKSLELPEKVAVNSSQRPSWALRPAAPSNHSGECDVAPTSKELPASWLV